MRVERLFRGDEMMFSAFSLLLCLQATELPRERLVSLEIGATTGPKVVRALSERVGVELVPDSELERDVWIVRVHKVPFRDLITRMESTFHVEFVRDGQTKWRVRPLRLVNASLRRFALVVDPPKEPAPWTTEMVVEFWGQHDPTARPRVPAADGTSLMDSIQQMYQDDPITRAAQRIAVALNQNGNPSEGGIYSNFPNASRKVLPNAREIVDRMKTEIAELVAGRVDPVGVQYDYERPYEKPLGDDPTLIARVVGLSVDLRVYGKNGDLVGTGTSWPKYRSIEVTSDWPEPLTTLQEPFKFTEADKAWAIGASYKRNLWTDEARKVLREWGLDVENRDLLGGAPTRALIQGAEATSTQLLASLDDGFVDVLTSGMHNDEVPLGSLLRKPNYHQCVLENGWMLVSPLSLDITRQRRALRVPLHKMLREFDVKAFLTLEERAQSVVASVTDFLSKFFLLDYFDTMMSSDDMAVARLIASNPTGFSQWRQGVRMRFTGLPLTVQKDIEQGWWFTRLVPPPGNDDEPRMAQESLLDEPTQQWPTGIPATAPVLITAGQKSGYKIIGDVAQPSPWSVAVGDSIEDIALNLVLSMSKTSKLQRIQERWVAIEIFAESGARLVRKFAVYEYPQDRRILTPTDLPPRLQELMRELAPQMEEWEIETEPMNDPNPGGGD